ncbi:MAG TPA: NAD(P)-dependent oxidoreductase [Chitinophagaceae bacterium]|jgi:phosphoglycerate dehydrogenase-like enzyme|nr:NAD(P)-dependent oxidoreductase [Chitinophagaceae bacterium]
MNPLLIILDDWEGRIQASTCWTQLKDLVEIKFLKKSIQYVDNTEIEQAQFLMAIRERTALDKAVFKRMPNLKLVLQTGGHAYHIDTSAAQKQNIIIALGRRGKAPLVSVPELTFAFALSLMHKVHQGNNTMHSGQWQLFTGRTLSKRRLGILGLGRHGSRVAHIASTAFNMEVVAWNRGGNTYDTSNGVKRLSLDELLETSDIVSIHLRLSEESTGLMNKERLEKMKAGAILINTSRGAIVDENALVEALTKGTLAGAGLDVFTQEPLAIDSPLRTLDNVIITPHIGWTVEEVFEEFAQIACAQLIQYLNGTLSKSELLS